MSLIISFLEGDDKAKELIYETELPLTVRTDKVANAILALPEGAQIELIATRNYVPPQTTFYATWLVFGDERRSRDRDTERGPPRFRGAGAGGLAPCSWSPA